MLSFGSYIIVRIYLKRWKSLVLVNIFLHYTACDKKSARAWVAAVITVSAHEGILSQKVFFKYLSIFKAQIFQNVSNHRARNSQ